MAGPEVEQPNQQQRPQWGRRQEPQRPVGLFDLHGIGFAKASKPFQVPIVPQVTIEVDGKRLQIPETPLFTSNTNGYTEVTNYQVYAPLKDGSKLTASASDPAVKVQVSAITEGRATVKATYQGKTKTYLIN